MSLLNIIDKIYESSRFSTYLWGAIIVFSLLFIIVLVIGIHDSRKSKEDKEDIKEEEVKDISFEMPTEEEQIKEDVTFEMPVLTRNLADFKKNIEEEIKKDDKQDLSLTKTNIDLPKLNEKNEIILDQEEIENTVKLPKVAEEIINTSEFSFVTEDNSEQLEVKNDENNL